MNRYSSASKIELAIFTAMAKLLTLTELKVDHRKLEGSPTHPKLMFYLKENNPAISHIEWVCKGDGTPQRMRVIVSPLTKGTDFYKALTHTLKGTKLYGGIVINWEAADHKFEDLLTRIGTLAKESEVVGAPTEESVEEPTQAADVAKAS